MLLLLPETSIESRKFSLLFVHIVLLFPSMLILSVVVVSMSEQKALFVPVSYSSQSFLYLESVIIFTLFLNGSAAANPLPVTILVKNPTTRNSAKGIRINFEIIIHYLLHSIL